MYVGARLSQLKGVILDPVRRFGNCVFWRFMDLRHEPAALAVVIILLVCTQVGFWIDAHSNWGFDPMNLDGSLLLSVGTALFWAPLAFILLVAGTQRAGWLKTGTAVALMSRLAAAALLFLVITAAATVLLVPAFLTGLLTLDWNETVTLRWSTLGYAVGASESCGVGWVGVRGAVCLSDGVVRVTRGGGFAGDCAGLRGKSGSCRRGPTFYFVELGRWTLSGRHVPALAG